MKACKSKENGVVTLWTQGRALNPLWEVVEVDSFYGDTTGVIDGVVVPEVEAIDKPKAKKKRSRPKAKSVTKDTVRDLINDLET